MQRGERVRPFPAIAITALIACGIPARTSVPPGLVAPFTGYESPKYRDSKQWLCRPDLPDDPCHGDLSATELLPNGELGIVPSPPLAQNDVDCFYVYPTVDLRLLPGNHDSAGHRDAIIEATMSQAALFREACTLYVPLYRQITIGTYFWGDTQREQRLEVAYSDIEDAFLHYMGQYNHGHKIVLIGHSQGAEMVVKLLQRRFDNDPVMRAKLLVAMPIGGPLEVGSLAHIPICTATIERGCAIGYHSYATDAAIEGWPWGKARSACANPADLGGSGWHAFSRAYLPTAKLPDHTGVTTPFVMLRDAYWGTCAHDGEHHFLAIEERRVPGDVRPSPLDLHADKLAKKYGLHVLDLQFELGDLIDLVKAKAQPASVSATPG